RARTPRLSTAKRSNFMSIQTTPQQQRQLLDVQSLDSQLARLRTQLSEIRQDEQLAALRQDGAVAVQHVERIKTTVEEKEAAAKEAERVIAETTKRRDGLQSRMDAEDVPSRDVQAVTMEIAELTLRIESLEEAELEAMQALEETQAAFEHAQAKIAEAQQAVNVRITTLNEQGQQLSKQGKELTAERAALADELPAALVREYEQLYEHNQGIGVVELTERGLSGAGLPIAPAELAVINKTPEDELAYCPDTGAILVRN